MILVTVGSSNIVFDRLFRILDELCAENVLDGKELLAQTGKLTYKIQNYQHLEFVPSDRMEELQRQAKFIICHAGTGTVIGTLKKGKKVIVFPRLKEYGEHESDHQLDLANQFSQEGYVLCAQNKEELSAAIGEIDCFVPKPFVSNTKNFCALIRGLI